jgi:CarboxypepD_reg-like domain/Gram-negative bacterial TonB protein C-terminal
MKDNKNSIYTAADIQQYLDGKLLPDEMHAIEKAALDDEFLAEAIEGYAENKDGNWQKYLQQAKDNFTTKNETETKVVPLKSTKKIGWQAAAAILIIAGLAITYTLLNKQSLVTNPNEIAKITPAENKDTAVPENTIATNATAPTDELKNSEPNTNKPTLTTPATTNPGAVLMQDEGDKNRASGKVTTLGNKQIDDANKIPSAAPIANSPTSEVAVADVKETRSLEVEKLKRAETKAKSAPPSKTYQFISQVVAADNTPLPFANISIKSENFGTYADVKGNFRINSADSILTVQVKSVGYLPKYYTLNAVTNLNKIVLVEDKVDASNEVVIKSSNPNTGSRKATFLRDTIINVEPKDGWENYGTYVSNNFDIPEDYLKDKNRHGEVEVTFNVTSTGAITDIKIDKTACNGCDEAAVIRAIQKGPQWKTKQGKSGSAKIKVMF